VQSPTQTSRCLQGALPTAQLPHHEYGPR
jgi:hypothetical protein